MIRVLLSAFILVAMSAPAHAVEPWHLQPMDTWNAGECYRSPHASSGERMTDAEWKAYGKAEYDASERARKARMSAPVRYDEYGQVIDPVEQASIAARLKQSMEDSYKNAEALSRWRDTHCNYCQNLPCTCGHDTAGSLKLVAERQVGFVNAEIAKWKAAYDREQARKAKKNTRGKSTAISPHAPLAVAFSMLGGFTRYMPAEAAILFPRLRVLQLIWNTNGNGSACANGQCGVSAIKPLPLTANPLPSATKPVKPMAPKPTIVK